MTTLEKLIEEYLEGCPTEGSRERMREQIERLQTDKERRQFVELRIEQRRQKEQERRPAKLHPLDAAPVEQAAPTPSGREQLTGQLTAHPDTPGIPEAEFERVAKTLQDAQMAGVPLTREALVSGGSPLEPGVAYTFDVERGLWQRSGWLGWVSGPVRRARKLVMQRLSTMRPEAIEWLWAGYLPLGKLSLLAGPPDMGKSTIAAWMAAEVTKGTWPGVYFGQPRNVIFRTSEDAYEDTVVPRLKAAGADLDRVMNVNVVGSSYEQLSLDPADEHLADLEVLMAGNDVALLISDPIGSRLGRIDTWKDSEVRQSLEPLAQIASQTRAAVLGVAHLNKSRGGGNERIMGSTAFVGVPRAVFMVARAPGDTYVLEPTKGNVGPKKSALSYRIVGAIGGVDERTGQDISTSRIEWLGETDKRVEDLLSGDSESSKPATKLQACTTWLQNWIDENGGCVVVGPTMAAAKVLGFKDSTVRRARDELGLEFEKRRNGLSQWKKPVRQKL